MFRTRRLFVVMTLVVFAALAVVALCIQIYVKDARSRQAASRSKEMKGADPELAFDPELIEAGLKAWSQAPMALKEQYVGYLRSQLDQRHETLHAQLEERHEKRRAANVRVIWRLLEPLSYAGFLLLLSPLFVARRYPGRRLRLIQASVIASLLFFASVQLFGFPLQILRGDLWGNLSDEFEPDIQMMDAAFHVLDEQLETLVIDKDLPIGPTLTQLQAGADGSFFTVLLHNVTLLKEEALFLQPLAESFRSFGRFLSYLPGTMSLGAALIFLYGIRDVFVDIVLLPIRAAQGEDRLARRAVARTLLNLWRELLSVLCMVVVFLGIYGSTALVVGDVVEQAVRTMFTFFMAALSYAETAPNVSAGLEYVALTSIVVFLILNLAVIALGDALYFTWSVRILRLRFHEKVPLMTHRDFWLKGSLALLWSQFVPLMFIYGARPLIRSTFSYFAEGDRTNYLTAQLLSGSLLVIGFAVFFWLTRGLKALVYLAKFHIPAARVQRL